MQNVLRNLIEVEAEELYLIPVWISILIAGADGKIDRSEIKKAIQIANLKQGSNKKLIADYYKTVASRFEVNLKGFILLMPENKVQRFDFLINKLERANYLLSKLEKDFAHQLYLSFVEFANMVAHASGGILGLNSVSKSESKYIDLNMIKNPSGQNI